MTLRRADAVEASARCAHRRFADECRFGYFTEASLRFLHDFGATPDKARRTLEASSKSRSIRLKIFRKPRERPSFGNAFVNAGTSCEAGAQVTKIAEPGVCAFAPSTLHGRHVATRRVAMDEVVGWLDFYHAHRLRSILDHASPMTFEKNWDAIQWGQAA